MTYRIVCAATRATLAAGLSLNEASHYVRTAGRRCYFVPSAL